MNKLIMIGSLGLWIIYVLLKCCSKKKKINLRDIVFFLIYIALSFVSRTEIVPVIYITLMIFNIIYTGFDYIENNTFVKPSLSKTHIFSLVIIILGTIYFLLTRNTTSFNLYALFTSIFINIELPNKIKS